MSRGVLRSNQPPRSADPNRGNPGRQEGDGDDTPAVHTRGLSYQETILPAPTLTGGRTDALQRVGQYLPSLPPGDFPHLTRCAVPLSVPGLDRRFAFGLDRLIRGLTPA